MTIQIPATPAEFRRRFIKGEGAWSELRRARWGAAGYRCPRCGCGESWLLKTRRVEECRACHHQTSLTAGTIFHGTRLGLPIWFAAFYLIGRHGPGFSPKQFQRELGLGSYETAWRLLKKVRAAVGPEGVACIA